MLYNEVEHKDVGFDKLNLVWICKKRMDIVTAEENFLFLWLQEAEHLLVQPI